MSRTIETTALRNRDLFAMPNGSIYVAEQEADASSPLRARLWCAHPPDQITFDPPLIELSPGQAVQLLVDRHETGIHIHHPGYVKHAFVAEMNQRHQDQMRGVYANMRREQAVAQQRERALRPWWKKLFA